MTDLAGQFEPFRSARADLLLFRQAIVTVSRSEGPEDLAGEFQMIATHGLTALLGPVGFLIGVASHMENLQALPQKWPDLEPIPLEPLLEASEVSALVQAQVPRGLRRSKGWPDVDWFRPVFVFPRHVLSSVCVSWTSSVSWYAGPEQTRWSTEVHFWRTPRLKRRLQEWGYPLV